MLLFCLVTAESNALRVPKPWPTATLNWNPQLTPRELGSLPVNRLALPRIDVVDKAVVRQFQQHVVWADYRLGLLCPFDLVDSHPNHFPWRTLLESWHKVRKFSQ